MRELPVDAKAVCSDGQAGHVTDVIVDPVARKVTHIVVREKSPADREFLVPVTSVVDSSRAEVRLACTRAELLQFPEFTATHFVSASSPEAQPVLAAREVEMWTNIYGYEPLSLPYVGAADESIPIVEERVPTGELAFECGAHVQSSDGEHVGDVEAFVIRPEDASITHFVLRLGGAADRGEVTLPLSTVDRTADSLVHLRLSRAEVERLPAVPPNSKYRPVDAQPGSFQLVSIVFDAPDRANEALRLVRAEAKQGHVGRIEAAVIRKTAERGVHIQEHADLSTGRGAVAGAVAGGVLGLLGGPVGMLGGAAVGAAAGGLTGRMVDRGVPDRYLRDLGHALQAESSALVLLVDAHFEEAVLRVLAPLGGQILRLALSDDMLERLIRTEQT